MSSIFFFLDEFSKDLHYLVKDIENLLYEQPDSVLIKTRLFCEELVNLINQHENIDSMSLSNNAEKNYKLYKEGIITNEIYLMFEWIRKTGNKAAHNFGQVSVEESIKAHRLIFDLSVWYMQIYINYGFQTPTYKLPKRALVNSSTDIYKLLESLVDKSTRGLTQENTNVVFQSTKNISHSKKLKYDNRNVLSDSFSSITDYLEDEGLFYVDNRKKNGVLWVIGDWSIAEKLMSLKKWGIEFRFTEKGGKATRYQPSWYMISQ